MNNDPIMNSFHDLILIELIQNYNLDWNIISIKYQEKFDKDIEYCKNRFEILKDKYQTKDINELIENIRKEEIIRLENIFNNLKFLSKNEILEQFIILPKPIKRTRNTKHTPIITKDQFKREEIKKEELNVVMKKKKNKQLDLMELIQEIKDKDTSQVFLNPVQPEDAPDYDKIIKKRMDLSTIESLIHSNKIISKDDLYRHLLLMFMNARIYNSPTSFVYNYTIELRNFTKKLFDPIK